MKAWYSSTASMLLLTCLTACGGGGADSGNEGEVVPTPPPSSSSGGSSGGGFGGGIATLHEDFGDGLLVNFDEADTEYFFSQEYRALESNNPQDPHPSFYYPTCCFFEGDDPTQAPAVNLEEMGIVSDNGNPALLLNTGRFTAGQTRPDIDDSDPKKDTTTSDDVFTWGELDLSQDYRISFCVKASSGTRNAQVYVDNNTSGEANSYWGGGGQGSRIFNVPAGTLVPGQRVEINVPGNSLMGGEAVSDWPSRPRLVGTATSFLQFRVEGGSSVIFDDLLVEPQDENGQAELPECTVFQPATAPEAPEAPGLFASDGQISVSWSDVLGAVGYELAYNTTNTTEGAMDIAAADIEGTQHTIEGLANGTEYFVFLRVINSVGPGNWSEGASATPTEPVGDNCVPTTMVPASPTHGILWNVYDGCLNPGELGAVVVNGSTSTNFELNETEEMPYFTPDEKGTTTLDTRELTDSVTGDLSGIITATTYPKTFTWLARIDTPFSEPRGFEIETSFGEADGRRVKVILRPDDGGHADGQGRLQLEDFLGGDDINGDIPMNDGFHIYHVSLTLNGPSDVSVKVYRDAEDITALFTPDITAGGEGDDGGSSSTRLRIGDGSGSNPFYGVLDWLIWSDSATVAGLTPGQLVDELPEGIGNLGAYATTSWTGAALDLVGDSGSEPTGSITESTANSATFTASGGNMSSSGHRIYYVYQPVTGDFTFTARLTSVALPAEPDKDGNNAYRYGIMAMENIDAVPEAGSYEDLGRWLSVGYFHDSTVAGEQQGSRTVKVDKGTGSSRSRSSDDHQIGHYLRITRAGNDYTLESSSDGESFTELRSGTLENANGNPIQDTWYLGLFAAPGDEATLTFEDISIE